jgi:hypothetical protein
MTTDSDINALMTREQRFKARKWDKMFISRNVIISKAFLSLRTACACQVYMIFLNKCRWEKVKAKPMHREKEWQLTNNGEIQFTYAEAETDYGIPAGKFTRAIDELIRVGLIDIIKTSLGLHKDVTLYAISDRWEKFGTAEFIENKRRKRKQQLGFAGKHKGAKCPKQKQRSQIAVVQRA